jgi:HepT-like protein
VNAALQRLRAEIRFDRDAFAQRLRDLDALTLDGLATAGDAAQAAVALHHAYCAIESILLRAARVLEGSTPDGPEWHQALLHASGLEIPGVRPALLSRESVKSLRRLLGFRDFFRHGYAVPLDVLQLSDLRREMRILAPRLLDELDQLDGLLGKIAAEESGGGTSARGGVESS